MTTTNTTTRTLRELCLELVDDPELIAFEAAVKDRLGKPASRAPHPLEAGGSEFPLERGGPAFEMRLGLIRKALDERTIIEFGDIIAAQGWRDRANKADRDALRTLHEMVTKAIAEHRADNSDAAIPAIRTEIEVVIDQARSVLAGLDPDVADEDTADERGQGDAWRAAVVLAQRHDTARAEQSRWYSWSAEPNRQGTLDPKMGLWTEVLGTVEEPERFFDVEVELGRQEVILSRRTAQPDPKVADPGTKVGLDGVPRLRHELQGRTAPAPWRVKDRVAALRFLCRGDVAVWVPDWPTLSRVAKDTPRWKSEEALAEEAERAEKAKRHQREQQRIGQFRVYRTGGAA